jgi:hypothetical protein
VFWSLQEWQDLKFELRYRLLLDRRYIHAVHHQIHLWIVEELVMCLKHYLAPLRNQNAPLHHQVLQGKYLVELMDLQTL